MTVHPIRPGTFGDLSLDDIMSAGGPSAVAGDNDEADLISALLRTGTYAPEAHGVTDEMIVRETAVHVFCKRHQEQTGEAPLPDVVVGRFPRFQYSASASLRFAAHTVVLAHQDRVLRRASAAAAVALGDGDLELARTIWARASAACEDVEQEDGLTLDLSAYLDGSYTPPEPTVAPARADGKMLLYPGKWHTLIGPTGCGKSFLACKAVVDLVMAGQTVVYAHYEESNPAGTVDRLLRMGATPEALRQHLVWVNPEKHLTPGNSTRLAKQHSPALVVLDGINAACSVRGWDVFAVQGVGEYRKALVSPFTSVGAAVLSLGHPPKARDRQGERHSYGSTAWLDEVDGVGYRITPSATAPIGRGRVGYSSIASVKDRYGQVEAFGERAEGTEGWHRIATLRVDDTTGDGKTSVALEVPKPEEVARSAADNIADLVEDYLSIGDGTFTSATSLLADVRAHSGEAIGKQPLLDALSRLKQSGRLDWPEATSRTAPRPGRLIPLDTVLDISPFDLG